MVKIGKRSGLLPKSETFSVEERIYTGKGVEHNSSWGNEIFKNYRD